MIPLDWIHLDEAIYSDAAVEKLLETARRPAGRAKPDPWIDRNTHLLFDGAGSLTADQALLQGAAFLREPLATALLVRAVLRTAMDCGIVAFEDRADAPRFHQRRPGVVFVSRVRGVIDTRVGEIAGRGPSLATLVLREQRLRDATAEKQRKDLLVRLERLREVERDAAIPLQLRSKDHPPATTMGEFADLLPGFLDAMPTWRLGEMAWILQCLPRMTPPLEPGMRRLTDLDEVERMELAPPELADLELP